MAAAEAATDASEADFLASAPSASVNAAAAEAAAAAAALAAGDAGPLQRWQTRRAVAARARRMAVDVRGLDVNDSWKEVRGLDVNDSWKEGEQQGSSGGFTAAITALGSIVGTYAYLVRLLVK